MIDFNPRLVVAGVLGVLLAGLVLQPVLRGIVRDTAWCVQAGAAALALSLLVPVVLVIFDQTQHFRARELTEVGSAAFEEPPMSEAAARAIRQALRPGDSWALVTSLHGCSDVDLYAFYWLAFRLVPNPPNCTNADVELFFKVDPPEGSAIVARGPDYSVVRR